MVRSMGTAGFLVVTFDGDRRQGGTFNYHCGDMGYWTRNIDRIGKEGASLLAGTASKAVQGERGVYHAAITGLTKAVGVYVIVPMR